MRRNYPDLPELAPRQWPSITGKRWCCPTKPGDQHAVSCTQRASARQSDYGNPIPTRRSASGRVLQRHEGIRRCCPSYADDPHMEGCTKTTVSPNALVTYRWGCAWCGAGGQVELLASTPLGIIDSSVRARHSTVSPGCLRVPHAIPSEEKHTPVTSTPSIESLKRQATEAWEAYKAVCDNPQQSAAAYRHYMDTVQQLKQEQLRKG